MDTYIPLLTMEILNGAEDMAGPDTQPGFSVLQEIFDVQGAVDKILAADSVDL